jgi:dTDP-4-dehydrorhamnose reductase
MSVIKMKIVILGASGRVGSYLLPHLSSCGHEVLCLSRSKKDNWCADLTDFSQVCSSLGRVMPDVIVNLVAQTNIDECERCPQNAYLANVKIVENLAQWIEKSCSLTHLVQLSTDHLYDSFGPHKEKGITVKNYYGFSKYAGELAASKVNSTILRTNFFGKSRNSDRTTFSDWLVDNLIKGEKITVFDDVYFSPLNLQCLVKMLEIVILKRRIGVFNLGSREGMSKADFAFNLAEVLGLSAKNMTRGGVDKANLTAKRAKDMRMDSSRFEKEFGVELPTLKQEIQSLKSIYSYEAR